MLGLHLVLVTLQGRFRITLDMIFSVTDNFQNCAMLYLVIIYLVFYQQILNWFFGHYRTLTTSISKKNYINSE